MTRMKMNTIFIVIIAILYCSFSVGYSALSTNLKITGTTNFKNSTSTYDISYDNSKSSLLATNVGDAIDELEQRVEGKILLNQNLPKFTVYHYNDDYSKLLGIYRHIYLPGMTFNDLYDTLGSDGEMNVYKFFGEDFQYYSVFLHGELVVHDYVGYVMTDDIYGNYIYADDEIEPGPYYVSAANDGF